MKNLILFFSIIIIIIFFSLIIKESYDKQIIVNNGIYTAIIIEPRKHNALEFVLSNFTNMLDNRWNFIIFHGNKNEDYINNIINTKLIDQRNRIKLINLNVDNLSIHDYNSLLFNKSFYDNILTEMFLIFQTDTMICSNFKNNIYNLMQYDYVGAPWKDGVVGNGGLSLRRKSKMLEILNKCDDIKYMSPDRLYNEDAFFSQVCKNKVNIKLPSFEEALSFAIETVYSNNSFGIHKAWGYHNLDQIKSINNYCPGLYKLIELNN